MELSFDIEAPPLTQFSIEHWLYLSQKYPDIIPLPPTSLAPFPLCLHTSAELDDNLCQWELINGDKPAEALVELLQSLTTTCTRAIWGSVRFPLRAHTRTLELTPEIAAWGLPEESIIVPRVPFLIATDDKTLSIAVSNDTDLTIYRETAPADIFEGMANSLWLVVDPEKQWTPAPIPSIRVPKSLIDKLESDPLFATLKESGDAPRRDNDDFRKEQLLSLANRYNIHEDTAISLGDVINVVPAAVAQFVYMATDASGNQRTAKTAAASLLFTSGEDHHVIVSHTMRDYSGQQSVVYQHASTDTVKEAIIELSKEFAVDEEK